MANHRFRVRIAWLGILTAAVLLAGCGNKGPLVHPQPAPAPASSSAD